MDGNSRELRHGGNLRVATLLPPTETGVALRGGRVTQFLSPGPAQGYCPRPVDVTAFLALPDSTSGPRISGVARTMRKLF